jgi:hypothetical protein
MKPPTTSLSLQRQTIEHVIPACEKTDPQLVPALKAAALTIGWLERHAELVKEVARLHREAPVLAEILKTGATIADVRSREISHTAYNPDGGIYD